MVQTVAGFHFYLITIKGKQRLCVPKEIEYPLLLGVTYKTASSIFSWQNSFLSEDPHK